MNYVRLASWLVMSLVLFAGCDRDGERDDEQLPAARTTAGDDAALGTVRAAVRALAEPDPSVDYVAAEMKGVIKGRTNSQALIQYDGYRAVLTTPRERVTRVTFELVDAKPTVAQVTKLFGAPEPVGRGMLYEYASQVTGARIRILAEPSSKPATETSLVHRVVIEGAPTR